MVWIVILSGLAIAFAAGFIAPHAGRRPANPEPALDTEAGEADEELWTADALARLGTPDTVAEFAAEGRAETLRGLGYRGDLPDS